MHHFLNGFVCFPLLSVVIFSCPLIFSKEGNLIHGIMFSMNLVNEGMWVGGGVVCGLTDELVFLSCTYRFGFVE